MITKLPVIVMVNAFHNHCIYGQSAPFVWNVGRSLSAQLADMIHHKSPRDPQTKNGVADD